VPFEQLLEIDRYALSRLAQLQADILAHYKVYEFHPVVSKLQVYCSEDLGAFYLDVLKDRLYTTGANSCWHAAQPRPRCGPSPKPCCAGWRRS
jgi:isoleucyl-tRNA synthetase